MSTFGQTTLGAATAAALSSNFLRGTKYTMLEDGHVTKLTAFLDGNGTSNASPALWKILIYAADGSAGYPGTLKATSAEVSIPYVSSDTPRLVDFTISGGVDLTAGDYYFFIFTGGATSVARAYRTAGGVGYAPSQTYGTAPSTFPAGASSSSFTYYVFATYTPATGNLPSNDVAPVVSGNTGYGSTLSVTNGSWSGTGPFTYTYQWKSNGTNISTASTYLTTLFDLGKTITCVVTATSATGATPATSNGLAVTASVPENLGKLRYQLPAQTGAHVVDLTSTPGPYFVTSSTNTWTPDQDYVIRLSSTVPRNGRLEIDATGARSVVIIGGLWALDDGANGAQNYHIHISNLKGWAWVEGQEADMARTHADFLAISGGSLYTPDVYFQNCRMINLTSSNDVNHTDIFQPTGRIGHVYADKITFSSNYDGYTIASDGSLGNQPAKGFKLSRHNAWYSDINTVNPVTALFWIMNINGSSAPSPIALADIWIDLTRGAGRAYSITKAAFYPNEGLTASGSPYFPDGALIGASDDGTFASFSNPAMLVTGGVTKGSPNAARADVSAAGDFVPAGIGYNYSSPGYESTTKIHQSGSWVDGNTRVRLGGAWAVEAIKKRMASGTWS